MISNERQYKKTRIERDRFEEALRSFRELDLIKRGVDPIIVKAQRAALESQFEELDEQIRQYEQLKGAPTNVPLLSQLTGLGKLLIQARIARGLSQKALGDLLGIKEQQIQRYEADFYQTASLRRVEEAVVALGLEGLIQAKVPDASPFDVLKGLNLSKFPQAEIRKRGWLKEASDVDALSHWLRRNLGSSARALHRRNLRVDAKTDVHSLVAWQARVLEIARSEKAGSWFTEVTSVVEELKALTMRPDGPRAAVDILKQKGVVVVTEPHLPNTALDGAAMLLDGETPVIGLTLRHDRLDNFWFVLLHELGHIALHLVPGSADGFFDEETVEATSKLEKQADEFALGAFIPDELWKSSLVRLARDSEEVVSFAEILHVHPSIVAGRLRRERNDWKAFTDLVGYGQVRTQF